MSYSDFYDRYYEEAINNIRDAYEPTEDEINEELTDMYKNFEEEYGDAEHERRRDEKYE